MSQDSPLKGKPIKIRTQQDGKTIVAPSTRTRYPGTEGQASLRLGGQLMAHGTLEKLQRDLGAVERRIDRHVGAKLMLLRRERNLSQEDLAGLLGLSQATIHHYEKGNDRISASRLLSIARALESSIAYFYEGAPE